MNTQIASRKFSEFPKDYAGLIRLFPLRPVHDQIDAANATEIIDTMAGHRLTSDQEDYLDVLSTLVAEFEERADPVELPPNKPIANLRRLMDDHGLNASDLGRILGNRALGSKVLRGERGLSLTHIKKLMKHFAVDASAFL
jgi:HTH-type transcriptional regulator/antitoxin HigA